MAAADEGVGLAPNLDAFHPAIVATDTANLEAGASESLLTRAGYFGVSALTSGIASIYNTGANLLGEESVDVAKWLDENDQHLGAYYSANKGLVDTAGFIGTSLIPGGFALKGLQLAKAGTLGGAFARTLGYASSKQQVWLEKGLTELGTKGGSVYSLIDKNKLASIAWGTADQMLSVAAFETAVAATMKQSPLLEKDEWTDVASHIALTSLAFGGVGGGLEAIAIGSIFKKATVTIDAAIREHDHLTQLKNFNLPAGDKAYGILASMLRLPSVGRDIEFTYRLAGKESKLELPTKDALERAFTSTRRRAWEDFNTTINELAAGDPELGQGFSGYVKKLVDDGLRDKRPTEEIVERLQDHLLNVGKIVRVSADASEGTDSIFYLADAIPKEKLGTIKDFNSFLSAVINRAPTGSDVSKNPYRLAGSTEQVKLGLVGLKSEEPIGGLARFASIEDAFSSGTDAAILANGTIRINPKSKLFQHVQDPVVTPRSYFNTRVGAFSDVAFPTVADLASTTKPLAVTGADHVVSGGRNWTLKAYDEFPLADLDTSDTSARYVWAQQVKVVPTKVSEGDVPLLERIYQDGAGEHKDKIIRFADDTEKKVEDIRDFGEFLKQQKLRILENLLRSGSDDVVNIATKLNVDADWVQRAIAKNFTADDSLSTGVSIPLAESLKPQNLEIHWDFAKAAEISNELTGKKKGVNPNVMTQTFPDGAGNIVYGELGLSYRIKAANEATVNAFAAVMGAEDAARFLELNNEVAAKAANQLGAGPGILSFSNADYGDPLRLWSQYTGQLVDIIAKKNANATLQELQPLMLAVFNKVDAAGKRTAAAELGVLTTALRRNPDKFMIHPEDGKRLINVEAVDTDAKGAMAVNEEKLKELEKAGRRASFTIESPEVANFLAESVAANARRLEKMKVLATSKGFNYNYDPRVVYAPPVDTSRYPFFAFVRKLPEFVGGSSEVSMITARTEAELRQLTSKVPEGYEALFDKNTKAYHKAKGDYDYALTLKEPTIDSTLQRRGVLGDFFPEVRAENVLDDYINWHQRQEVSLVRRAVETRYSQTFTELKSIGEQFQEVGESKFGGVLKRFKSQVENPYEDYLKTALNVSKRSEFTLLHDANEYAEALGRSAYRIFGANQEKAMKGTISWEEANKLSEKYGIAGPYRDADTLFNANLPAERNVVREFVGKANMLMVNSVLRLDLANSLVNIISTPILLGTEMASIKSLVANNDQLAGKLLELRSIGVPGSSARVPSTVGLIASAIKNFWSEEKDALLKRYTDLGAIQTTLSEYHKMVEWISYKPYQKMSELAAAGNKAVEIGAKISRNEWAEQFTRFVSADVMRQLTDPIVAAGRLSLAEQDAYISVFVNRVQGNYLASQRPIAFQGVLGSAISLFQTYQFNLLQQLFRHVENHDVKAIATLAGLQGGIYGLNGIPFFDAVNTHLIGNSSLNPGHKDAYSTIPQLNRDLGNWMMYGTASAFPLFSSKSPALYTRGDINPRHISIVPISPLDVPAVDGSIRFVKNLLDMGGKLVKGMDVGPLLLEGLEHNSLSRPLAGIAQTLQGYGTTSKGSLISASNDFSVIATLSRISGAKPMDESLALNSLFRLNSYQAADQARIQDLGEVVKSSLRAGKLPELEELHKFQLAYAKAGGRIENYSKTLQRWSRDANVSVVNQLVQQHRTTYSSRLQEIMGGTTLPDFRQRLPSTSAAGESPE